MNEAQALAFFYLIPIALWLALLSVLFRVWWGHHLEDSLAYLVFLRERKLLFISLLVALTAVHIVVEFANLLNSLGQLSGTFVVGFGLVATTVGALIVFLFAWFLLRGGDSAHLPRPLLLDGPEHIAYSLGVLDRAEARKTATAPAQVPASSGTAVVRPGARTTDDSSAPAAQAVLPPRGSR